ncbi:MAG TPA: helix-turn-helix domain-containing protein [Pyrinomonadaceae bacterium]|nr:helix-turn-helix domain-containing protein [Pyrinomonadaceae bacterium]
MLEQRKHYAHEGAREEAAEPAASSLKVKTLKELTLALLREVESLKGHEKFEGRSNIDFADEVRRFETDLIRWALMHTGGHQRRAARMLNIKVTTLNAKIKRYGIRPHALPASNVVDFNPDAQRGPAS